MPKLLKHKEVLIKDKIGYEPYKGVIVFRESGVCPRALIYVPSTPASLGMLAICELCKSADADITWQLVAPDAVIDLWYNHEKYIQKLLADTAEEPQ
jgi:hypothetical protein